MDTQELQRLKNKYDIIGNDPALNGALETAVKFAPTDLTVLITGESGVGKENISRIIHQYSSRRSGKFFAVNCGAIPEGTINSELFGHVKGSFTGAIENRAGYFEEANGGTLFLDEIAELPLASQALLLRVLQSGEYMKVGSTKVEHTNVRVIAATNVNLSYAVSQGKFRQDLYYRLNAAQIRMPALRERKDDIYLLFRKFTSDFSEKYGMCKITLSHDAIDILRSYRWPGNIRQLMNVTQTVTALESQKLTPGAERIEIGGAALLQYMPREEGETLPVLSTGEQPSGDSMANAEKQAIYKAILDLKGEVDSLRRQLDILTRNTPHHALPQHTEAPQEAEWQGEEPDINTPAKAHIMDVSPEEQPQYETSLSWKKTEDELIRKALEKYSGNRKLAARELGMSERTLYRKLPPEFKSKTRNDR